MKVAVEVLQCSAHRVMCLGINGRRVVGRKCCGTWDDCVVRWDVEVSSLKEEIKTALKGVRS